jgi:putative protease
MRDPNVEIVAALPGLLKDRERQNMENRLAKLRMMGVNHVLAESLSQIVWAKELGFRVRGGFGLNAYNSRTLAVLRYFSLESAAVPFELRFSQIDAMSKELPVEILGYGRLPVLTTAPGLLKGRGDAAPPSISDRSGFNYPVYCDGSGGSTVFSSKKLFLADRAADYSKIGVWGVRLVFTTENSLECAAIMKRYTGRGDYRPQAITRGLYYPEGEPAGDIL